LVAEVNQAIWGVGQALVSLAGEPGEGILALYAKTNAVILDAVGDGTGNAAAPVRGLSEAVSALGTDVGAGDIL